VSLQKGVMSKLSVPDSSPSSGEQKVKIKSRLRQYGASRTASDPAPAQTLAVERINTFIQQALEARKADLLRSIQYSCGALRLCRRQPDRARRRKGTKPGGAGKGREQAGLAPSWPAGVARDGNDEKAAQTEAISRLGDLCVSALNTLAGLRWNLARSILAGNREGKMAIPACCMMTPIRSPIHRSGRGDQSSWLTHS
jgi:hypothetical protein